MTPSIKTVRVKPFFASLDNLPGCLFAEKIIYREPELKIIR